MKQQLDNMETIYTVDISGETLKLLNEMSQLYDDPKTEIIRKAIGLYYIAKREQAKGNKIMIAGSIQEITGL
jgi:hypothetical protein